MADKRNSLSITAVGDIALNGVYGGKAFRNDTPWSSLTELKAPGDLLIGNLESPVTSAARFCDSKYVLRASQNAVSILRTSGFDILNLANNHAMDFGPQGLIDTLEVLDSLNIGHVGAGLDAISATDALIVERRGQRVAVVSFCDVYQVSPLYATPNQPGVSELNEGMAEKIRLLTSNVDWIIVILHWGEELNRLPSPAQRHLARDLVKAGADAIIGHHPHVIQPMEVIDRVPVWYSLGNFSFSNEYWRGEKPNGERFAGEYRVHPLARQGGIASMFLSRVDQPSVHFVPTTILNSGKIARNLNEQSLNRWSELCSILDSPDYENRFNEESRLSAERRAQQNGSGPLIRKIRIKAFQFGLLGKQ